MASKTAAPASNLDELDNFFLDGDLDDDPFASPKGDKNDSSKKRKEPGDGLGIDEEVSIAKKARVPRIKLDQDRLMSQKGIPALRRRAKDLKFKGKGHEWGDASRLLSFYQEWLDDLFPKAKFLDALAMVEKAGHNKMMHKARVDWINEGKPKASVVEDGDDLETCNQTAQQTDTAPKQANRIAPIFEPAANNSRPKTPEADDLFGEEDDIYNATPIAAEKNCTTGNTAGEPDEDELDALMAEAEGATAGGSNKPAESRGGAIQSIFGDGGPTPAAPAEMGDDDDLDALIAEAEAAQAPSRPQSTLQASKTQSGGGDEFDDLDALVAEAEAYSAPSSRPPASKANNSTAKPSDPNFDDEEEAMAEMDGLW